VVTNDYDLYERAFGFHDQGHKPLRTGLEIGNRSIIGINLRINELTGAVALAQLRKLDRILLRLHGQKTKLKNAISDIPGIGFRRINDEGECSTLITLLFETKETAEHFGERINSKTLSNSGWHVYNNMEQIINKKTVSNYNCPFICGVNSHDINYQAHMLPQTDNILERAINISVGVVDTGLGSGFGININSDDDEIAAAVENIRRIMKDIM